jgi:hypothetical protein
MKLEPVVIDKDRMERIHFEGASFVQEFSVYNGGQTIFLQGRFSLEGVGLYKSHLYFSFFSADALLAYAKKENIHMPDGCEGIIEVKNVEDVSYLDGIIMMPESFVRDLWQASPEWKIKPTFEYIIKNDRTIYLTGTGIYLPDFGEVSANWWDTRVNTQTYAENGSCLN